MSLRCMVQVLERYPVEGGPGEKLLALCLADNAHDDGTHIYPSVPKMAERSLQSERTVQRQLGYMVAMGFLQMSKAAAGRGRPAHYQINPAWLKGDPVSPITRTREPVDNHGKRVTPATQKGDPGDIKRVTPATKKGDTGDTTNKPQRTCHRTTPLPPAERGACAQLESNEPDARFDQLVAVYPRKRADAMRAAIVWVQLQPDAAMAESIIAAARALAAGEEWREREGQYAPKLSKWLRNRGWDQAPAAAPVRIVAAAPAAPKLTPEQLRRNAERARELADQSRRALGMKRLAAGAAAC